MISRYDDVSFQTLIGAGAFIKGDLRLEGFIRLDGDVDGNVETSGGIIIGEQARIRGNIHALSVTVNGIVEGDITAPEGITLFSTASVRGDIITKKIRVEENVFIQGHCIVLENEDDFNEAKKIQADKKAISQKILGKDGSAL